MLRIMKRQVSATAVEGQSQTVFFFLMEFIRNRIKTYISNQADNLHLHF